MYNRETSIENTCFTTWAHTPVPCRLPEIVKFYNFRLGTDGWLKKGRDLFGYVLCVCVCVCVCPMYYVCDVWMCVPHTHRVSSSCPCKRCVCLCPECRNVVCVCVCPFCVSNWCVTTFSELEHVVVRSCRSVNSNCLLWVTLTFLLPPHL